MTKIKIQKIIWDEWNTEHIKKHGVIIEEVNEAAKNVIYHKKAKENRYLATGRSGKRIISMVVKRQEKTIYYLVTARDASKKERKKLYEREVSGT